MAKWKRDISKFKLATMDRKRAKEIFLTLSHLSENGMLNFKNAQKNGITYPEWLDAQHVFLSTVAERKDEMKAFLFWESQEKQSIQ